jgi:hypothetical protein
MATGQQGYSIQNFQNAIAAGIEFPSHYLLTGTSQTSQYIWSMLDGLYQSPKPPLWNGFVAMGP